jgi:hypothetical protein
MSASSTVDDTYSGLRNSLFGIFIGAGAAIGGMGAVVLALPSDYELLPRKFKSTPQTSEQDVIKKIAAGETYLQSLAGKGTFERMMGVGVGTAAGLGQLAVYFTNSGSNGLFLSEGILFIGIAIVDLLFETTPERENRAYKNWKAGISSRTEQSSLKISLSPGPGGIGVVFRYDLPH